MESRPVTTRSRKTASPVKTTRAAAKPSVRAKSAQADATAPTHEQIALRAHELYVRSGYQRGREQEFWLEAERQLQDEAKMLGV